MRFIDESLAGRWDGPVYEQAPGGGSSHRTAQAFEEFMQSRENRPPAT
jgi:hypothetical protein